MRSSLEARVKSTRSRSSADERVLEPTSSAMTGMREGSNLMTVGAPTSAGSIRLTMSIFSRISKAAKSIFVPQLKANKITVWPSEEVEDTSRILLTVARVASKGLVTKVSISCGAAPGSEAITAAMGNCILGSKSTGVRV